MNTYIPTTADIYMICFITMRGWRYEYGSWYKEGYKRTLAYYEEESNDFSARNNLPLKYDGTDFSLEQAYHKCFSEEENKL